MASRGLFPVLISNVIPGPNAHFNDQVKWD
jgi:hypothetical protein